MVFSVRRHDEDDGHRRDGAQRRPRFDAALDGDRQGQRRGDGHGEADDVVPGHRGVPGAGQLLEPRGCVQAPAPHRVGTHPDSLASPDPALPPGRGGPGRPPTVPGVTVLLGNVIEALEARYDPALAEGWDAVGLVCGDRDEPVRRVLFAVDPTAAVVLGMRGMTARLASPVRSRTAVAICVRNEDMAAVVPPLEALLRGLAAAGHADRFAAAILSDTPAGPSADAEEAAAAAFAARHPPGAVLYVLARDPDGPPAPLAVLRLPVGEWPVRFRLDDAQAMDATRPLSSAASVVVEARISAHVVIGRVFRVVALAQIVAR